MLTPDPALIERLLRGGRPQHRPHYDGAGVAARGCPDGIPGAPIGGGGGLPLVTGLC